MYEQGVDGEKSRSGISPTMIVFIVLVVVAIIFVLQNSESHKVNFLMVDFKAPSWVIFALLILVGVVLDRLLQYWMKRRKSRSARAD